VIVDQGYENVGIKSGLRFYNRALRLSIEAYVDN